MNRDQLLMAISKPLLKDRIIQLASGDSCHVSDLILLSSYPVGEIAFRASRILEHVLYFQPEQFIPYVSDFINIYTLQKNHSCQRHFTKILMYLTNLRSQSIMPALADPDAGQLIVTTFEWLIEPETPVAVKVNWIDILFNLRNRFSWISAD